MLLGVRNRVPGLLAVGALVMLAAVVARGTSTVPVGESRPLFGWLRLPTVTPSTPGDPEPFVAPVEAGPWAAFLGWFMLLLPVVLLGIAVVAAVLAALRQRRLGLPTLVRPEGEPGYGTEGALVSLLRAARAARSVFADHQGGPPSDAVIAAWLELEWVAADSGNRRFAHQTPTEFTDRLVAGHAAVRDALDLLRGLYQRARFGAPDTVGRAEADAALRALDEIVVALGGEPVAR